MNVEELSVDVIPKGKESDYLTVEESIEVRRRMKQLIPLMGILIFTSIAMILIRIFEPSLWVSIPILSISILNAAMLMIMLHRLSKYIKTNENFK